MARMLVMGIQAAFKSPKCDERDNAARSDMYTCYGTEAKERLKMWLDNIKDMDTAVPGRPLDSGQDPLEKGDG